MARYVLFVETNALADRDAEFNRWYSGEHLADVLALEGFVAAERFRLVESVAPSAYKYAAVYEIETADPDALMQSLSTAKLAISPALDPNVVLHLYESISERRVARGH